MTQPRCEDCRYWVSLEGARIWVVIAIAAYGDEVPRLFSTEAGATTWADATPLPCIITHCTVDDPDEQNRKRSDLS